MTISYLGKEMKKGLKGIGIIHFFWMRLGKEDALRKALAKSRAAKSAGAPLPPSPPPVVPPAPEAKEAEKPFEVGNVQVATEASEAHPTENQDAVLEDKDLAKKRGIGVVCDGGQPDCQS
jgi:hypothetical protein